MQLRCRSASPDGETVMLVGPRTLPISATLTGSRTLDTTSSLGCTNSLSRRSTTIRLFHKECLQQPREKPPEHVLNLVAKRNAAGIEPACDRTLHVSELLTKPTREVLPRFRSRHRLGNPL